MPKFNELTLSNWTQPASNSEETKLSNAERLVKDALKSSPHLNNSSYDIFGQGSYANDTNVRLNSDIDINVKYKDAFYYDLPANSSKEAFGLNTPAAYSFEEYKNDVETALVSYFGRESVKRNNKCITVVSTSSRVETDVVPTWNYRRYSKPNSYVEGVYFVADTGAIIHSYPKQHIENGKKKNANTQKRFKRLTRVLKKLRYKMMDDGATVSPNISSFLIECLLWNVPDSIFNNNNSWTDRLKEALRYLFHQTANEESCKEWGEVSELLYLFYSSRKWSRQDVHDFVLSAWHYMEFKD